MPGNINFYLKKKVESTGRSLIKLRYKYSSYDFVYTFGETINPANWNEAKQRVKSNKETTLDGKHSLNDLIDNLERECKFAYNNALKNGIPNPSLIKAHLDNFINQNKEEDDKPTLFKLIERFINNEIKYEGKNKASETIKKYITVKNHLIDFQAKKRYKIDFDTITLDFFYKFLDYLNSKKLAANTIAKDIQVIKTFMNEAIDLGYTNNIQHKHRKFTAHWEDVENIYLSHDEIIALYNHDLSGNNKLERVRDLFVFGCFTGLRFSDYSAVKPENIINVGDSLFIKMYTKKTEEQVIIPCNPIILKIFDKYAHNANRLPRALSNQKFNEYIKKACEEAELNEKGRLIQRPEKALWESVSSHTARRSFATNLYLDGYPTIEIMKITGHKTEKAFLKYIKVTKLDAAKRLDKYIKMKWSEKLLKVAS